MPLPSWVTGTTRSEDASRRPSPKDLERAYQMIDQNRPDDALRMLAPLLEASDPELQDQARNYAAYAYALQGQWLRAETCLQQSLRYREATSKDTGYLHADLGVLQRRQGRLDDAERSYATALDQLRGTDPEMTVFVLRNVEGMFRALGRNAEADDIESRLPPFDPVEYSDIERVLAPFVDHSAEPPSAGES